MLPACVIGSRIIWQLLCNARPAAVSWADPGHCWVLHVLTQCCLGQLQAGARGYDPLFVMQTSYSAHRANHHGPDVYQAYLAHQEPEVQQSNMVVARKPGCFVLHSWLCYTVSTCALPWHAPAVPGRHICHKCGINTL